jgi:hypothetical protein
MKQLKEERIVSYFRSIALTNDFILKRMKEIKNGRPLCGCGACHECYYVYLMDRLSENYEKQQG